MAKEHEKAEEPPCGQWHQDPGHCPYMDQLNSIGRDVKAVKDAVLGTYDQPGLAERVRTIESAHKIEAKERKGGHAKWGVIGTAIGAGVAGAVAWFKTKGG